MALIYMPTECFFYPIPTGLKMSTKQSFWCKWHLEVNTSIQLNIFSSSYSDAQLFCKGAFGANYTGRVFEPRDEKVYEAVIDQFKFAHHSWEVNSGFWVGVEFNTDILEYRHASDQSLPLRSPREQEKSNCVMSFPGHNDLRTWKCNIPYPLTICEIYK